MAHKSLNHTPEIHSHIHTSSWILCERQREWLNELSAKSFWRRTQIFSLVGSWTWWGTVATNAGPPKGAAECRGLHLNSYQATQKYQKVLCLWSCPTPPLPAPPLKKKFWPCSDKTAVTAAYTVWHTRFSFQKLPDFVRAKPWKYCSSNLFRVHCSCKSHHQNQNEVWMEEAFWGESVRIHMFVPC